MFVLGAYYDGIYKTLLALHIFCAIVGFGAVYLNALYGQEIRKHRGAEGLAVHEANLRVSQVGQYFIYGVFVFGLLLVFASDDVIEFSQTWVWLSMLLYVVGISLSHGVLLPAVKRMGVLMKEMVAGPVPNGETGPPAGGGPPPQAAEMEALGKRVGATGATLDLLIVVILVLMVWRPGF